MNRLRLPALYTFILILLTILVTSQVIMAQGSPAAGPVVLTDEQEEYPLGLSLEILQDPGGDLTIEQISSPEYDQKFEPSQEQVPVFGFTNSAYWARIHLRNQSTTDSWFLDVLYSNLQFIDLYTPLPDANGFAVRKTGSLRPPPTRDLRYPRTIFILTVPSQGQETIYLRFQSGTSMTLNLKLWSERAFFNSAIREQIAFGLFFGVLIGLFFYNLFLLFTLQEANYVYFVLLIGSIILHEASYNGYLETYIIPSLYFAKRYYHPVLFSLMVASLILFADSFLEFKKRIPKLHWVTLVSTTCCGFLILLIPFVNYRNIAILLLIWAFTSLLVVLTAGIINYARGKFRPAPLFMIAWFSLVALFLDVLLVRLGVTASTFFSENIYRLGILLVAIFWSISLADRVNELKDETENANRELHQSERRLSQVLDAMPLGVVLYANDSKPIYGNRSWFELLTDPARDIRPDLSAGRTVAEAIEYYSLKSAGGAESYPIENFPAARALEGQPSYADDIEMQRGDKLVPLEMWASPILGESGKVESAVVVFQDISQRKMAEDILRDYGKHMELLVEERTADLNNTNRELRLRLEWLAAVNFINQMIAHSADFMEIYRTVVDIVNHLFATQDSFIAEYNGEDQQLIILAHSANNQQPALNGIFLSLTKEVLENSSLNAGASIILEEAELNLLEGPFGKHVQASKIQSLAFVPLLVREQVLGFLGLEMREKGKTLTPEEANLLTILSTDIAQLIEDARLFRQAKLLAAAEERNRLARELHDSVAQTLYSITLFIDATRLALNTNKQKVVESHLEELTKLSKEAMADMRLLIFELRPPILEQSGLVVALQSRLESVEAKAGFQTHFETEGKVQLSPVQESEMYRIAQEALNNIMKHAQADQVSVRLVQGAETVKLSIEDNGVGFDPRTIEHSGGQGFRNMHERAAKIGASCEFETSPGRGTKITIEVNE